MTQNLTLCSAYDLLIRNAVAAGIDYLKENPSIKSMVMGISGGIDSAVTAALARKVCDAFKDRQVLLIGFCMPIDGNKPEETERAEAIGAAFCHQFQTVPLDGAFYGLMAAIDPQLHARYTHKPVTQCDLKDKIRAGNIKARVRMINLYNRAHMNSGMVLSTDNFTELQLGFWTLHGDVGDFGFIQELWKTEVYGLAEALGEPLTACVEAKPTDGLGVTDSDIDQLLPGWKPAEGDTWADAYRLIDDVLIDYLLGLGTYDLDHPAILRCKNTVFKRENPVSIKRDLLTWVHGV